MSTFIKLSIFISILSVIVLIKFPDISNYSYTLINNLINELTQTSVESSKSGSLCVSPKEKLFTVSELTRYDGSGDSLGLYLSFLGVVYDVSKGAQHYSPGNSYAIFAGRDATKAYITGDFTESGLIDDLRGVDIESFDGIQTWIDLYEKDYIRVGRLIGTYYDSNGCPTEALLWVHKQIDKNNEIKELQNQETDVFPYCNSEWSEPTQSGRVWCSYGSGGTVREWVGVPRQLFMQEKKTYRCACVRNTGPPTVTGIVYEDDHQILDENNDQNMGDLNNPRLKEYEGCPPNSFECKIKD